MDVDKNIDIATLKPNMRVALRSDSYTLHKILPSKVADLLGEVLLETLLLTSRFSGL